MIVEGLGPNDSARRPRVLLVEDSVPDMELGRDLLQGAGYVVVEAETAQTALVLARTLEPDLVLMSFRLPGLDPSTATRELRGDAGLGHIPVVALIADPNREEQLVARAAGCAGFISKPIDIRTFVGEVARHLPGAPKRRS